MSVKLGKKYRDPITGFEGVAVGYTVWLHQCRRIALQSDVMKDGIPTEAQWFDEPQLVSVETKKPVKNSNGKTGGPPAGGVETG